MNTSEMTFNNKVKFIRYCQGMAYYALSIPYSEKMYSFPVPVKNVEEKVLVNENNSIFFMDYISKAIQEGTLTILPASV